MDDSDNKSCDKLIKEKCESKCINFSIDSLLSNNEEYKTNIFSNIQDNNKSMSCINLSRTSYHKCDNFIKIDDERNNYFDKNLIAGGPNCLGDIQQLNNSTDFSKEQHETVSTSEEMVEQNCNEGNLTSLNNFFL